MGKRGEIALAPEVSVIACPGKIKKGPRRRGEEKKIDNEHPFCEQSKVTQKKSLVPEKFYFHVKNKKSPLVGRVGMVVYSLSHGQRPVKVKAWCFERVLRHFRQRKDIS